MLALTFVTASLVTAALSLDATVVLLTPVVISAAASDRIDPGPSTFACVRLANSASLLLPVSNLTNLLALPYLDLTFHEFVLLMAPVWLVVIFVEYAGHRLFFRRELRERAHEAPAPRPVPLHVVPVAVVAGMLVGFAALSPLGVEPAWVAIAAALVLTGYALPRRSVRLRQVVHSAHLSFAVFVVGLGVVVASLSDGFLTDVVRRALPDDDSLPALLLIAGLATLAANLVNNLPATLMLVPLVAPLGDVAVLAALVGLNVGSGLSYPGSLANLLWRRTVARHGPRPRGRLPPALVPGHPTRGGRGRRYPRRVGRAPRLTAPRPVGMA